jgi:hypothetical protein
VTVVIAPWREDSEIKSIMREQKFNPVKDAVVRVDILKVAKKLNEEVQMSESEFRDLLKNLFSEVPSYHLSTVVRIVR